jgi:hypothetical protein
MIYRILINFVFAAILLPGCTSASGSSSGWGKAVSGAPDDGAPLPHMGEVERDFEPDLNQTPYKGEKRFAAHWTDAAGEQVLIISRKITENDKGGREEIFGYQYRREGKGWIKVWKIHDFVIGAGCDLAIHLPIDVIKIQDIDGDHEGEVSFVYELDNRCDASMVRAKFILHHRGKKYAIRGYGQQYLGPPEHIMNQSLAKQGAEPVEYKEFDPAFELAPAMIREFASQAWDDFIRRENEGGVE